MAFSSNGGPSRSFELRCPDPPPQRSQPPQRGSSVKARKTADRDKYRRVLQEEDDEADTTDSVGEWNALPGSNLPSFRRGRSTGRGLANFHRTVEQLVVRCGVLCVRSQGYGDDLHGMIGIWVISRPARPATDRQVIS